MPKPKVKLKILVFIDQNQNLFNNCARIEFGLLHGVQI